MSAPTRERGEGTDALNGKIGDRGCKVSLHYSTGTGEERVKHPALGFGSFPEDGDVFY